MNKTTQKSFPERNWGWLFFVKKQGAYCLLFLLMLYKTAPAQDPAKKITASFTNAPLKELFSAIEAQSGYLVNYAREEVNTALKVTVQLKEATVKDALTAILKTTPYRFSLDGNIIIIKPQPQQAPRKEPGKITGRVIDEENGQPVAAATVRVGNTGTTTDMEGAFTLSLPGGRHTATISYIGYGTKEVTNIDIKDNGVFELNVTLKRKKGQLSTVVVRSSVQKESVASLYARQKNAASVTDGISAEQIGRTPDVNIGQVLNRVSGVTTVNNKYVVVRGLSERYNQAMIDGIVLPSTNMNKRNFSFDVIPQELVSNVIVNKTATPDLSSEFSGGQVSVNTMDIPVRNFTSITIGTGYNSQTTGKDFLVMGGRGSSDYLGFDDGRRKLPDGIVSWDYPNGVEIPPPGLPGNTDPLFPGSDLPYSSLDAVAQSKKFNVNAYKVARYKAAPDQNYRLAIGRTYAWKNDLKAGFAGGLTYRNQQRIVDFNNVRGDVFSANWMDSTENGGGRSYRFNTTMGAALNAGLQGKKFRVSLKNMYSRIFDDNYNEAYRLDYGGDNVYRKARELFQEPQVTWVWQHKLEAERTLSDKGLKLELSGGLTNIRQNVQDQRRVQYFHTASIGGKEYFQTPNIYSIGRLDDNYDYRLWTQVKETDYNWNLALSQPFDFLQNKSVVKLGYSGWHKHRTLGLTRVLSYAGRQSVFEQPYEVVLDPGNIGAGLNEAYYYPEFLNGPNFDGTMVTQATYLMLDQRLLKKLRLVYGVRAEHYDLNNRQEEYARKRFGNDWQLFATTGEKNWRLLPSANLTYNLTPATNIRMAYSKTAIRPDFRETSYFGFYDYELDANISGRQLTSTIVDNIDLRYEWYPSPGEIISISGFYKKLKDPIELIYLRKGHYGFQNQYAAVNYGVEMEVRKSLGFIADRKWLHNLVVFGNGTLLQSEVEVQEQPMPNEGPGSVTRRYPALNRPLYGQSPWIVNAGIAYQDEIVGFTASYNRSGHRSFTIAFDPNEMEYEKGRNMLDIQLSAKLLKQKIDVKLNLGNLLDEYILFYANAAAYEQTEPDATGIYGYRLVKGTSAYEKEHGDKITYRSRTGRTASLSLAYRF